MAGLVVGLAAGLWAWFSFGVWDAFVYGLVVGLVYWLAYWLVVGLVVGLVYPRVVVCLPSRLHSSLRLIGLQFASCGSWKMPAAAASCARSGPSTSSATPGSGTP